MTQEQIQEGYGRLSILADHLLSGKLFADRFYFGEYRLVTECGTTACGVDEAVELFPDMLQRTTDLFGNFIPCAITGPSAYALAAVFGTDEQEYDLLFLPDQYGGQLPETTTRQEVAIHILRFLDEKGYRK